MIIASLSAFSLLTFLTATAQLARTRGFALMRGGAPITVNGEIVRAIGVSTNPADRDEAIARSGIAAFAP